MKLIRILFILLIVMTLALPVTSAVQDTQSVGVTGEGTSKDSALNEAKRLAVEQAVGVYVLSETLVENFQVVKDSILTKSSGFISSYTVVSETSEKGIFKVKIQATVGVEPLVEQLGKLGLLRAWTVAVILIPNGPSQRSITAGRSTLNGVIVDTGFKVVDQTILVQLEQPDIMKELQSGNYTAATRVLRDNGVDVLIVGSAYSVAGESLPSYEGVPTNISGTRARIDDARAIRVDTAEIIAAAREGFEGKGFGEKDIGESRAMEAAADLAGKYFVKQIAKLPASPTAYIQLIVSGLKFAKLKSLQEAIQGVEGVRSVKPPKFVNQKARYEIEFQGDANQLAEKLSESTALKKFGFEIESLTSGKIEATAH